MTTSSSSPVMAAAARRMCSSCSLVIADGGLDRPLLLARQDADKRRVLPKALALVCFHRQDRADSGDGQFENRKPLVVSAQQSRGVLVSLPPAAQVCPGGVDPIRALGQLRRDTPGDLQGDLVVLLVVHQQVYGSAVVHRRRGGRQATCLP